MMKNILFPLLILLAAACAPKVELSGSIGEEAGIFPDYKDVTVPVNIAPLNLSCEGADALVIEGAGGRITVAARNGAMNIPEKKWHKLLAASAGSDLTFTVCRKDSGKWLAYNPFKVSISSSPVDEHLAYRLIAPGYVVYNSMGIYQRDLTSFRQTAIYENKLTGNNCVNCHSFNSGRPDSMVFHLRGKNGGTVFVDNGKAEKLNTKTDSTISALVYPYWHPSGKYIVFSTNSTAQVFHYNNPNRIEVYDSDSDVVVYDTERHEVFSCPQLKDTLSFETFPTFSPDGRSIYFCTAEKVEDMPEEYRKAHYSLCRISFDPQTATFGETVDTLFHAGDSLTASFPRVSPDGRFLAFTRHSFGNFSIWHKDADLWMIDLASGERWPMAVANSNDVESYHSWSSNGRWLVFSSRRDDGLYTKPYLTYIDEEGQARKPFLLPQKNPKKFYNELMFSYNIPEFVSGKVADSKRAIASEMKNSRGTNLTYRSRR